MNGNERGVKGGSRDLAGISWEQSGMNGNEREAVWN